MSFHFCLTEALRKNFLPFAQKNAPPMLDMGGAYHRQIQDSMPREMRYFLTMRATLKVMASSNSRRSRPVSFLIYSRRYTRVFRWTKSFRAVSDTFRLFSKNLLMVSRVSWSRASMGFFLKTSWRNIWHRMVGSW